MSGIDVGRFMAEAAAAGIGQITTVASLPQSSATPGQLLTWSGVAWLPEHAVEDMTVERTGRDLNGKFTTVTYKRADGTIYRVSVLSGGTSPEYTTKTVTIYAANGSTPAAVRVFALTYNEHGEVISEVLQ